MVAVSQKYLFCVEYYKHVRNKSVFQDIKYTGKKELLVLAIGKFSGGILKSSSIHFLLFSSSLTQKDIHIHNTLITCAFHFYLSRYWHCFLEKERSKFSIHKCY